MKTYNLILNLVILTLLCITSISALEIDNVGDRINPDNEGAIIIGGEKIDYNPLWEKYPALEVSNLLGLGETYFQGAITDHTESCDNCASIIYTYTSGDYPLVEDFRTYTIKEDGKRVLEPIRGQQFYIKQAETPYEVIDYEYQCIPIGLHLNGSIEESCANVQVGKHTEYTPVWQEIQMGQYVPEGKYILNISGQKRPDKVVDWQIKVAGEWTTEWSIWGSSTSVTVNGPSDLPNNAGPNTDKGGMRIFAKNNITVTNFTIGSGTTATQAYILNSSKAVIYTGTLTATKANFSNAFLSSNKYYYLAVDASGAGYNFDYDASGNSNAVSTYFNWTGGLDPNGGSDVTRAYIIKNVSLYNNDVSLVIQNSPADNATSVSNLVTFNATATVVGGATVVNMSLFLNGILNKSNIYNSVPILREFGFTLGSAGGDATGCDGVEFKANQEVYIYNATLTAGAVADECRIVDGVGGTTLETGTKSGDFCLFSGATKITAGTKFVICIQGTTSYNYGAGVASVSATNLNYTGFGCFGAGGSNCNTAVAGQARAIVNVTSGGNSFTTKNDIFNQSLLSQTNWSVQACDSDGDCGITGNRSISIDTSAPIVNILYPTSTILIATSGQNTSLNFTAIDDNLGSCWYNYNNVNITLNCALNSTFLLVPNQQSLTVYANDTVGNVGSANVNWSYNILFNSTNFTTPILEGEVNYINSTFLLNVTPTSVYLNYNGTLYVPSISTSGNTYNIFSTVVSPSVSVDQNISFYYSFLVNGSTYNSTINQQRVLNVNINTTCGGGSYSMLNITNYDEETLALLVNGTVEYTLNLINNDLEIVSINGSNTGTSVQLCSSQNLTSSFAVYNLELRYYKTGYAFETYNIQTASVSNLPLSIPLYFLNSSIGTQFKINYLDFYYIAHPDALIQVQRQYLAENTYKVVEIPKIGDNGQSQATFNANNIRYKLIMIENGVILDIFENVFPLCQNIVLGTCELDLRGNTNLTTTTTGDFTYTLEQTNTSIILTYIIPSGTPRNINLIANQNSRFLSNITNCDSSLFASGGTITCNYNQTVGDSIIDIIIYTNGADPLYGQVLVAEDLPFQLNNWFIAFILLLTLALIFITSGVMLVISSIVGLLFLGVIFLIKGAGLTTVSTSIMWFIIAGIIIVYKIAIKEEKT